MKYNNLILDNERTPASEAELAELEAALGCRLPSDYRSFLSVTNGGSLDYDVMVEFQENHAESMSFSSLYAVERDSSWETNPFELERSRSMPGFPTQKVLPIGRDGGSSVLYLDMREGYRLVAYIHGLPAWTGLRQTDTLVYIADSFDEYLSRLHISDEFVEEHLSTFEPTPDSVVQTLEWLDSGNKVWREKYRSLWNRRVPFSPI